MPIEFIDLFYYILSGAGVGLMVGLTGVGGGSLMTPLLIMMNIPYHIAIGTDLLYAAITKASGVIVHHKRGTIEWRIVNSMLLGSLPTSFLTALVIRIYFDDAESYRSILTLSLGVMLMLTAAVLLLKDKIKQFSFQQAHQQEKTENKKKKYIITFISGCFLGIFVTLSSVGAGAFGTAILMILFTRLPMMHIVGTDLAHAVPLTFVAGMSHFLLLGNIDFLLLAGLLIGSIPAVTIGARLGSRLPEKFMYNLLASILMLFGAIFVFS